jgi:hypothetical protein
MAAIHTYLEEASRSGLVQYLKFVAPLRPLDDGPALDSRQRLGVFQWFSQVVKVE